MRVISAEATATLAKALGVTPAAVTAVLAKASAQGGGVNLVKFLASELHVTETKAAAGLKALGADGP